MSATGVIQSLDEYLVSLRNRGLSDNYISKLSEYLGKFCDWVANTLQTLSTKCAEKFLSKSVHLKPNSRARYATYLKGFLDYLNIPFDVKVKVPKTLPDYIESSDIDQIVEWIKSKQSHKKSIDRDLRRWLYWSMTEAGFVVLNCEWWHFEYGTRRWGAIRGNDPLFGPAEIGD